VGRGEGGLPEISDDSQRAKRTEVVHRATKFVSDVQRKKNESAKGERKRSLFKKGSKFFGKGGKQNGGRGGDGGKKGKAKRRKPTGKGGGGRDRGTDGSTGIRAEARVKNSG